MANKIAPLTETPAWKALGAHYEKIRNTHLRTMFADDPRRAERFSLEQVGLYFDYSKHRVTEETIKLLLELAEQSGLRERIDAMFRGDRINITENRAVLHVALRAPRGAKIILDGAGCGARGAQGPRCDGGVFRRASATAAGKAKPASRFATSSISASAARTWAR